MRELGSEGRNAGQQINSHSLADSQRGQRELPQQRRERYLVGVFQWQDQTSSLASINDPPAGCVDVSQLAPDPTLLRSQREGRMESSRRERNGRGAERARERERESEPLLL